MDAVVPGISRSAGEFPVRHPRATAGCVLLLLPGRPAAARGAHRPL